MERYKLNAAIRTGKGRLVRRSKQIPAVLYGRNTETLNLAVPEAEVVHFINHGAPNALIDLVVAGETHTAMVKDLQRNKIKGEVLHIDFYAVDLKQELTTTVPIHLVGDAEGVRAGGILQQLTREIEVKCLPTEIPQSFDLDISAMNIGDTKTVADLEVTGNIEILTPEAEVIVSILAPRLAEEEEATETTDGETGETPEPEAETE
ncbi:MAG: 50S ribosomal protein L25 [Bacillota bacterium]|jgi:large subunit ribosomal protein L25